MQDYDEQSLEVVAWSSLTAIRNYVQTIQQL